jgi:hypothetical protein
MSLSNYVGYFYSFICIGGFYAAFVNVGSFAKRTSI